MLVAACTLRKADHVEKRDPRELTANAKKHTELDNNARLEKRLFLPKEGVLPLPLGFGGCHRGQAQNPYKIEDRIDDGLANR